ATATLYRVWRAPAPADPCGGRGATPAFAEDYAAVIQGLLDLYEAGFEIRWLQWAERLQARMDARFWDEAGGGYFNSAADDPSLVLRLKEDYDGAEPAPSSIAALNLLRLGALLGDGSGHRERGLRTIEAFRGRWERAPHAVPQLLCAFELGLESPRHVVLAGDPADPAFQALAAVVAETFGPRRSVLAADGGEGQRWLAARSPWLAEIRAPGGRPAAFLCEEQRCLPPVADPAALRDLLASPDGRSAAL
ncbi:MAG: thioredoxin domain-containing protein, partial [Opitutaceae bacterium]